MRRIADLCVGDIFGAYFHRNPDQAVYCQVEEIVPTEIRARIFDRNIVISFERRTGFAIIPEKTGAQPKPSSRLMIFFVAEIPRDIVNAKFPNETARQQAVLEYMRAHAQVGQPAEWATNHPNLQIMDALLACFDPNRTGKHDKAAGGQLQQIVRRVKLRQARELLASGPYAALEYLIANAPEEIEALSGIDASALPAQ